MRVARHRVTDSKRKNICSTWPPHPLCARLDREAKSAATSRPERLKPPQFEPWHPLCRQIATGGLHCPVLAQRHQAIFGLGALLHWRPICSPNPAGGNRGPLWHPRPGDRQGAADRRASPPPRKIRSAVIASLEIWAASRTPVCPISMIFFATIRADHNVVLSKFRSASIVRRAGSHLTLPD